MAPIWHSMKPTASLPLKIGWNPQKRNFIFQPVLFTGYVSLSELLVWERVSHITFVENMTQHWGRIKPSPGLGNTAAAGSPKQNTNTHGRFQKYGYPQSIHLNRVFHYKPSILGYPYFWKHPHSKLNFDLLLSTKCPTLIFIQETSPIFEWNKNNSSVFSHLDLGSLRTGALVCFVGIIFWLFVSKDMGLKAIRIFLTKFGRGTFCFAANQPFLWTSKFGVQGGVQGGGCNKKSQAQVSEASTSTASGHKKRGRYKWSYIWAL